MTVSSLNKSDSKPYDDYDIFYFYFCFFLRINLYPQSPFKRSRGI